MGYTCTEDTLQVCNGAIKIVSKVSPLKILQTLDAFFFETTLFFWMKGMAVD